MFHIKLYARIPQADVNRGITAALQKNTGTPEEQGYDPFSKRNADTGICFNKVRCITAPLLE